MIEFETTDENGEILRSEINALASMTDAGLKLSYVEDISGDGRKTKCIMLFSKEHLRVTRQGELNVDFLYESGLTHHTTYGCAYGNIPVTVNTTRFLHTYEGINYEEQTLADDFSLKLHLHYTLTMGTEEPMMRKMKVHVKPNRA